jgi:hypothetical protein
LKILNREEKPIKLIIILKKLIGFGFISLKPKKPNRIKLKQKKPSQIGLNRFCLKIPNRTGFGFGFGI